MKNLSTYTLKIWLTAVIIAPIILIAMEYRENDLTEDTIAYTLAAILFGCALSIPSFILFRLTIRLTARSATLNIIKLKLLWSAAGLVFTALPFAVMFGREMIILQAPLMILIYYIIILLGIWIFRFEPKADTSDEDERLLFSAAKP